MIDTPKTRMQWIAEQMAENGMYTQAAEVLAMEKQLAAIKSGDSVVQKNAGRRGGMASNPPKMPEIESEEETIDRLEKTIAAIKSGDSVPRGCLESKRIGYHSVQIIFDTADRANEYHAALTASQGRK